MLNEIDLIRIRCYEQGQQDGMTWGIHDNPYESGTIEYNAYEDGFWKWVDKECGFEWIGVDD